MIRSRVVAATAVLLLVGLAACSAGDAGSAAAPSAAPRTVTDPSGATVVIPGDAQRVFGMYTTDLDYALTLELGLAPVQSIRSGSVGFPDFFPADRLGGIEPLVNYPEPEYEKIAAAAPDVIVNGLGYEGGPDATKLAAIAPTFTYDGFDGDWRDDFNALAGAFGKEAAVAAAFLQRVDTRTAEVEAEVEALGETPTVAYGWANEDGSGGFIGTSQSTLNAQIFAQVGLRPSKAVGEEWTEISHEKITELADVDLLMIAVETDTDQEAVLARVRKDPIWSQLPAVREGRVVAVNNELSYASPHAHLTFLDVVQESLPLLADGR